MQLRPVESVSSPDKCPLYAGATIISVAHPDKQHLWLQCHQKWMDHILNLLTKKKLFQLTLWWKRTTAIWGNLRPV